MGLYPIRGRTDSQGAGLRVLSTEFCVRAALCVVKVQLVSRWTPYGPLLIKTVHRKWFHPSCSIISAEKKLDLQGRSSSHLHSSGERARGPGQKRGRKERVKRRQNKRGGGRGERENGRRIKVQEKEGDDKDWKSDERHKEKH